MRPYFSKSARRLAKRFLASALSCGLGFAGAFAQADYLQIEDSTAGLDLRVWANDGGDKVPQEILRAFEVAPTTLNSVWNGTAINLFAARNEVVSFGLVVDNNGEAVPDISVAFDLLDNASAGVPATYSLATTETSASALYDWTNRPIEVFVVEYLRIHGLSLISYPDYDETHVPQYLQRPIPFDHHATGNGAANVGEGVWADRPHHDLSYPDIAIPQEIQALNGGTAIAPQNSQIFWVDIYVPKDAPAGDLTGSIVIALDGVPALSVPVTLSVYDFALPDERRAKTMVYIEPRDIKERYFSGAGGVLQFDEEQAYREVINRHFRLAWRHGVSLFDANELLPDILPPINEPNIDWQERFSDSFYSAANGYAGPGADIPHDIFVVGSYGAWAYWWDLRMFNPASDTYDANADESILQSVLEDKTAIWENWFQTNAPDTIRFLYVDDEPGDGLPEQFAERVASYVENSPTAGNELGTFITASPLDHALDLPSPSIFASLISVAPTLEWELATAARPERQQFMYNGRRPASGTFATEDDGVALRSLAWAQYKKDVERWFYWHATYYNNIQWGAATRDLSEVAGGLGETYRNGTYTNVFKSAHTFGGHTTFSDRYGENGSNYGNGDGLLFYPGTDLVFPDENLGLEGPIASLRLKHWRRGIQDVQYLELAKQFDAPQVESIVQALVPEVLWEIGVQNPLEPSYVHKAPTWSTDVEDWEQARRDLAEIIRIGMLPVAPEITTQPESMTGFSGDTLQLTVIASGNPASDYQWFKVAAPEDIEIDGAVFAALSLQPATLADAGDYYVVITNPVGAVQSETVSVSILPALTAPEIVTAPEALAVLEGELVSFTVVASGNPTPTYQWQKDGVDVFGATTNSLVFAAATLADAGMYSVIVSNSEGIVDSGPVSLNVEGFTDAPAILVQPLDQHVLAGETINLVMAASGTPEPSLSWFKDGVELVGETDATLSFVAERDDAGSYVVRASNSAGSVDSAEVQVVVGLTEADVAFIVANASALSSNDKTIRNRLQSLGHNVVVLSDESNLAVGTAGKDLVVISGSTIPRVIADQFVVDPRPILVSKAALLPAMGMITPGGNGQQSGQQRIDLLDNLGVIGSGLPLGDTQVLTRSKIITWSMPTDSARVIASVLNQPTKATIFSLNKGDLLADGTPVAGKRVGWYDNGFHAGRWTADAGILFDQAIAFLLDSVPSLQSPPVISSQPSGASVTAGVTVTLSAGVIGVPTPALQWFRDGVAVAGGTSEMLEIVAGTATVGDYQLVATNSEGTASSATATLSLELDTVAPVLGAVSVISSTQVLLSFSEAVTALSATAAPNYTLDPSVTVQAVVQVSPDQVELTTDPLPADTRFVLGVSGIEDASGNVLASDSSATFSTAPDTASLAFVVGALTPLSKADGKWYDKMLELGFEVELFDDNSVTLAATATHSAVVISGTVLPARITTMFVADTRPILVSEYLLFDDFQLTGSIQGVDYDLELPQTSLALVDNGSQLGTGFVLGETAVTSRARRMAWGLPTTSATVFASMLNDPTRAVVFGYPAGAVLADGQTAGGKRLAWHEAGFAANRWTNDGETLFGQALSWLVGNQ